jgi:hypothetical protein
MSSSRFQSMSCLQAVIEQFIGRSPFIVVSAALEQRVQGNGIVRQWHCHRALAALEKCIRPRWQGEIRRETQTRQIDFLFWP